MTSKFLPVFRQVLVFSRNNHIWKNNPTKFNFLGERRASINGRADFSLPTRNFHFSSSRRVISPLIWAVLRPLLKGGIFIFGRFYRRRIWDWLIKNRRVVYGVSLGFVTWSGVYYYQHLEEAPITGRKRFVILNGDHLIEMGKLQAKLLLSIHQDRILPNTDSRSQRVRRVVQRLLEANKDLPQVQKTEWRIYVVESEENNAFVLPSGDIFFLTGMFQTISNEDQLAIILSHELSHAILGHSLEMLSWTRFLDWFLLAGAGFVAVIVPGTWIAAALTDAILDKAVSIAFDLPYNRRLESEADKIGLELAAKACFDTRESYAFWLALHMKKKLAGEPEIPSILSTHPDHGERAERLDAFIERSLDIRAKCPCPPLKRYDPRILADAKKRLVEEELTMRGFV